VDRSKSAKAFTALAIIIVLNLLPARAALPADSPSMGDILVTNTSDHLILYSYLKDGFSDAVSERLQSGLPITFTYHLELRRKRPLWRNSKVADRSLTYKVKYDTLKKEYIYTRNDEHQKERRVTRDYREMQRWVTFLDGVKLADYNRLKPGKKYYVRIKAEIKPLNTPFPLRFVRMFIPFLDQDTSWQESAPFVIRKDN
jgi:hypothetical protein